jgi:hypothetical protein
MLEVLVLIALTNYIGKIVEAKGHKSSGYKWGAVGLWFGGEIGGVVLGTLLTGGSSDAQCVVYLVALLGAAVGAFVAVTIAKNAEPLPGYPKQPTLSGSEPPQNPQ